MSDETTTGVWYCPVCGYVDPQTTDTHCPQQYQHGMSRPMFREVHRGYYVRVGLEEAEASVEAAIDPHNPKR